MPTVLVTGPTVTQNLPFSSPVIAVTIANTHFAYQRRDDQAELVRVAWLSTQMVYSRTVNHLGTNPARRRVTSLMCPTTLPLSQTAIDLGLCEFFIPQRSRQHTVLGSLQ